jgi:hypothetical protein
MMDEIIIFGIENVMMMMMIMNTRVWNEINNIHTQVKNMFDDNFKHG